MAENYLQSSTMLPAIYSRDQLFQVFKSDKLQGITQDDFKQACQGNPAALYKIGRDYDTVRKEYIKAFGWYLLAAEHNYGLAYEAIGYLYEYGLGVPIHFHIALDWYLKAAKQGISRSFSMIGHLFLNGKGVPLDLQKGNEWLFKYRESSENTRFVTLNNGYKLTQEQENKSLSTLISETENILQFGLFKSLTFESFKNMKETEINLINNIRALQNNHNMFINMNSDLSNKVEVLKKENESLKFTLSVSSSDYNNTIKNLQNENMKLRNEKAVLKIRNDNSELARKTMEMGTDQLLKEKMELVKMITQLREEKLAQPEKEQVPGQEEALREEKEKLQKQLDKDRSYHKRKMEDIKKEHKATIDSLLTADKKHFEREKTAHTRELEKERSIYKRVLEKKRNQIKRIESQKEQVISDLKEKIHALQQLLSEQQADHVKLQKLCRQDKRTGPETLKSLDQSRRKFEKEILQMNTITTFMQNSKNNWKLSANNEPRCKKESKTKTTPLLSQSALLIRRKLDYESEIRRKRRRGEM